MSTASVVSMEELELERAELLPSRETLCCGYYHPSFSYSFTQIGGGNVSQFGLVNIAVPILSGNNISL